MEATRHVPKGLQNVLLMLTGLVLAVTGAVRLCRFISALHLYPRLTPGEVLKWLVLPHALMLLGAGLAAAGLVLLAKELIEQARH